LRRASTRALLHLKAAIARRGVARTARSESLATLHNGRAPKLTSFVTESNQRSNDSAQAHGLPVVHRSLSQKMTVQEPLRPSKSHAVRQHEVNIRRNNGRRSETRSAQKPQIGAKDAPNEEKLTVRSQLAST
jgi:hypothetical protein